jgi:hypothetical protein
VLARTLLVEVGVVVSIACTTGALLGLHGQWLTTRWGTDLTGYPTIFSPAVALALGLTGAVAAVALMMVALPGRVASRVDPGLAFEE